MSPNATIGAKFEGYWSDISPLKEDSVEGDNGQSGAEDHEQDDNKETVEEAVEEDEAEEEKAIDPIVMINRTATVATN